MPDQAERSLEAVRQYLQSFSATVPIPCPEAIVAESSLPAIFSPVAAFRIDQETHVLFMTGEYDFDDARLLAVIARYKALILPLCRTVFLTVPKPGEVVAWLSEPCLAAALVAAVFHSGLTPLVDPSRVTDAFLQALLKLFGVTPARMGEGLQQIDQVLASELIPRWTLAAQGRGLIRPMVRALNHLLRQALDQVLTQERQIPDQPLLAERLRIWKQGKTWYQFQSLEYIEEMFLRRQAGLNEAYQGLYTLNRNPDAPGDRVRLRVLTAPESAEAPDLNPFAAAGVGRSSLKGEFLFARRTLLEQHGVTVPDLAWGTAECPACHSRSNFRKEADPLTLYRVAQAMDRIKQMLASGQQRTTFHCQTCRQPLGFEHLILAGYAHYLADQDRDLHFLNERRPGTRRTSIQLLSGADCRTHAVAVNDPAVSKLIGRALSMVEFWRALLQDTSQALNGREFEPGLVGLALPPLTPIKQQMQISVFQDQLVQKESSFWPVALDLNKVPEETRKSRTMFPHWLGELAAKVTAEDNYLLIAYVAMDRIEAVFERAATKLGLRVQRALNGTVELRGRNLTIPIDLKPSVEEAIFRGHVPGVFAVREAGRQARRLMAGERTLAAIRKYLGPSYSIQYNPITAEVTIEGSPGRSVGFQLDALIREMTSDEAKTRRLIISKVG